MFLVPLAPAAAVIPAVQYLLGCTAEITAAGGARGTNIRQWARRDTAPRSVKQRIVNRWAVW